MEMNRQAAIASWKHTAILLVILGAIAVRGAQFQTGSMPVAGERNVLPLYASLVIAELLLLYAVMRGIKGSNTSLVQLAGGEWPNARAVVRDLLVAGAIWLFIKLVAYGWDSLSPLPVQSRSINPLLPVGVFESLIWILVSIVGGITEEIVFRGYFQRQFAALTQNDWAAIALQAIVFGISHGYQGVSACVKITLIGAVFGAFAKVCRSLRPGMIAHVVTDVLSGIARI